MKKSMLLIVLAVVTVAFVAAAVAQQNSVASRTSVNLTCAQVSLAVDANKAPPRIRIALKIPIASKSRTKPLSVPLNSALSQTSPRIRNQPKDANQPKDPNSKK